jgi:hypothetical protein
MVHVLMYNRGLTVRPLKMQFSDWCSTQTMNVGVHELRVLSSEPSRMPQAVQSAANIVRTYYTAEERVANILARLGKTAAAQFIQDKLPTVKKIQSGDLAEILAAEYVSSNTQYEVPIKRLRWKDHRNMSMRGEDVIGIERNATMNHLNFLKAESKSRMSLATTTISEAREGLDKDNGLPSAHALSFISTRLHETGRSELGDAIDDAQLRFGITAQSVEHLLFTLSGNSPTSFFTNSLSGYTGSIRQRGVGVVVTEHAEFVRSVFDRVIEDANNS